VFWLALGATAGVLAVRRLTKMAAAVTPRRLADSATGLGDTVRVFAEEVRAGMAERELELRDALGLDGLGAPGDPGENPVDSGGADDDDQYVEPNAAATRRARRIEPFGDR
jgi:hypothetical protein